MTKTPDEQNYRMPAEWYPHSATQLHWPANRQTWPDRRLERVERVYLDIIEILHQYEPIHLFVPDENYKEKVSSSLSNRSIDSKRIIFHLKKTNDVWARDCGSIFIRKDLCTKGMPWHKTSMNSSTPFIVPPHCAPDSCRGVPTAVGSAAESRRIRENMVGISKVSRREQDGHEEFAITDWEYNAWGGKYPPFDADNKLPAYLADTYGLDRYEPSMVLEGGSIETNGEGVLLTTESVLLNPNRNPELSKQEIEQRLKAYLGMEKIIWLKEGLAGDDTDGHIDDIARFLNKNTILAMVCEHPDDVNYQTLQTNLEILQKATDQHGNPFKIETLPLPNTKIEGTTVDGSKYVPASYANYYVANGVVLVPLYDKRYDGQALHLLDQYFSGREVVGIPCADLVWGQGSIHCITQQLYGLR